MVEQGQLKSVVISTVYIFVGLALIVLNRYILRTMEFPYPIFLSGLGILLSGATARVLVWSGYVTLQRVDAVEGILWYKRVLPVGFAHACTLSFGNMVYLILDVGFIQMLKSFTPVVILISSYLCAIEVPTLPTVYAVSIISLGTAATCTFSPELNPLGLSVMFFSILSEAIRLVLTQYLLQQLKFGVVEGQYVLAPASAFWLLLASLSFESYSMVTTGAFYVFIRNIHLFFIASMMGVAVNFLAYSVIQTTSGLTMKILGTLRNIITIVLGVVLYHEKIPLNEAVGYGVALFGFAMYNASKMGLLDTYPWLVSLDPGRRALLSLGAHLGLAGSLGWLGTHTDSSYEYKKLSLSQSASNDKLDFCLQTENSSNLEALEASTFTVRLGMAEQVGRSNSQGGAGLGVLQESKD